MVQVEILEETDKLGYSALTPPSRLIMALAMPKTYQVMLEHIAKPRSARLNRTHRSVEKGRKGGFTSPSIWVPSPLEAMALFVCVLVQAFLSFTVVASWASFWYMVPRKRKRNSLRA